MLFAGARGSNYSACGAISPSGPTALCDFNFRFLGACGAPDAPDAPDAPFLRACRPLASYWSICGVVTPKKCQLGVMGKYITVVLRGNQGSPEPPPS